MFLIGLFAKITRWYLFLESCLNHVCQTKNDKLCKKLNHIENSSNFEAGRKDKTIECIAFYQIIYPVLGLQA